MRLSAILYLGVTAVVGVYGQMAVVSNTMSDGKTLNGHCTHGFRQVLHQILQLSQDRIIFGWRSRFTKKRGL